MIYFGLLIMLKAYISYLLHIKLVLNKGTCNFIRKRHLLLLPSTHLSIIPKLRDDPLTERLPLRIPRLDSPCSHSISILPFSCINLPLLAPLILKSRPAHAVLRQRSLFPTLARPYHTLNKQTKSEKQRNSPVPPTPDSPTPATPARNHASCHSSPAPTAPDRHLPAQQARLSLVALGGDGS